MNAWRLPRGVPLSSPQVVAMQSAGSSADFLWLSHIAVPMLAVRADVIEAMNPPAARLFGLADGAGARSLAALFGDAAVALVGFLAAAESAAPPHLIELPCRIGGATHLLSIAALPMTPAADGGGRCWALTLVDLPAAGHAPPPLPSPVPAGWVTLLPAILDQLPVAVLIENDEDVAVFANRGFTEIFEYALEDIAALDDWWLKLYPDPVIRDAARIDWAQKVSNAPPGDGTISASEFQVRTGTGLDKMLQSHSFQVGGYRVHSYVDVSHRHKLAVDLRQLADTDALTGVFNRRSFFHHAGKLERASQPLAVLLLDLDHFKQVNDLYGHAFGDEVLVEISARCRAVLRPVDVLARIGGEEFALLLPSLDLTAALAVAERLRQTVQHLPVIRGDIRHGVTVSIGAAATTSAHITIEELLLRADRALYAAKAAGRNCVRFSAKSD